MSENYFQNSISPNKSFKSPNKSDASSIKSSNTLKKEIEEARIVIRQFKDHNTKKSAELAELQEKIKNMRSETDQIISETKEKYRKEIEIIQKDYKTRIENIKKTPILPKKEVSQLKKQLSDMEIIISQIRLHFNSDFSKFIDNFKKTKKNLIQVISNKKTNNDLQSKKVNEIIQMKQYIISQSQFLYQTSKYIAIHEPADLHISSYQAFNIPQSNKRISPVLSTATTQISQKPVKLEFSLYLQNWLKKNSYLLH